jgi:xanthine dehydrogenase accessory factor
MGHASDAPILIEILRTRRFPYVGVIGSDAKANVLRRNLAEAGLPEEAKMAFHCPIGIEIGTNHPYEIAVSAIAQLIQTRDALRLERSRQDAPDSSPP